MKTAYLAALAAFGLTALFAPPAGAQGYYHPYRHHYYRTHPYRHANRLSQHAVVAASRGHIYHAARLSSHAAAIRARHGY